MVSRRLSSDKRREQIAAAAATLFAQRGFAGVTTREISRKARVNEAIVFRHFPTKRALYTEIINQKIRIAPDLFDPALIESGDDAAVLRALAEHVVQQTEEDPTFLRLMLYSALEDNELADLFFAQRMNLFYDFLLRFVQKRMREGRFRRVRPVAAVRAFAGMIFNFVLMEELYVVPKRLRVSRKEAVEQFVEIYLNGMRSKGAAR